MTSKKILLAANENYYGCSPEVIKVLQRKCSTGVHLYPDFNPVALHEKIAVLYKVTPEQIITGAGSVRIIDGIIQTFVNPGEEVLAFENSFVAYGQLAGARRCNMVFAKQKNLVCDADGLLAEVNNRTRVIFIANPNNPTGTIISHDTLEYILQKVSPQTLVIIDEAYLEYVTDSTYPDSVQLQKCYSNLIILRTFSKAYGLAGLRIGYAIAEEKIIASLKQSRIPYSLNYLAVDAALAALGDQAFIRRCVQANAIQREYLFNELKKTGFNTIPSQANFIYLWFDDDATKEMVFRNFLAHDIVICNLSVFGQQRALRISLGDEDATKKIIACLKTCAEKLSPLKK